MGRQKRGARRNERPAAARLTYNMDEVAAKLGVGRNQAYEAARRGDLPLIRVGKRMLVPSSALDRLLNGD